MEISLLILTEANATRYLNRFPELHFGRFFKNAAAFYVAL